MASRNLPYKSNKENFLRFSTSYHEFSTSLRSSVPENVNCMLRLQSAGPPCFLHFLFGTAHTVWLRHTLASPPHISHPKLFQYKFSRVPSWNSRTCKKKKQKNQLFLERIWKKFTCISCLLSFTNVKVVTVLSASEIICGSDLAAYLLPANATTNPPANF